MDIELIEHSILLSTLQNTIWAIRPEWIPTIHNIVLSHFFDKEHRTDRVLEAEEKLGRKLDNSNNDKTDIRKVKDTNILVIPIHGVIGKRMNMMTDISGGISTQKLQDDITSGIDNPDIDAIVLDIESPGGIMDFTKETADFIFNARDKKPIIAFANGEMASAAYYIGSSASKVFSYDSALIGSIGVYMQNVDMSKFYEDQGTKVSFIRSKPLKAVPNKFEPLEGEGLAYIQGLVDSAYKMFVSDVARYRNKSTAIVENKWGTGQIFTAEESLRMGLIDKIVTSLDDVLNLTARMVNKKKGVMNMQGMMEGEEDSVIMEGFTHNSKTADTEESWGSIDKGKLPRIAHADQGEPDKKSSWGYPHHFVRGGSKLDKNGVYTDGILFLHRGGLNAAWAAANGARSGQEASAAVKAHLQAHRKTLGLDKQKGEQENIELLGEQNNEIGGEEKVSIFERIFSKGLKAELGDDVAKLGAEVEPKTADTEKLQKVEADLSKFGFDGKDLNAFLSELKHKADGYASIPTDIVSKVEATELTWPIVADYVKVCQKELDSICTDLVNAAISAKGEVNKDDLISEVTTKARILGLEAALEHGRKMIKAYQAEQNVKAGQKSAGSSARVLDSSDEQRERSDALVAAAKEAVIKFNKR